MVTSLLLVAAILSTPNCCYVTGNQLHRGAISAQKVHERHATQDDLDEANKFLGYVQGSVDALSSSGRICLTGNPTIGQIIEVVTDYMDTHPDEWEKSGAVVVQDALARRYVCK